MTCSLPSRNVTEVRPPGDPRRGAARRRAAGGRHRAHRGAAPRAHPRASSTRASTRWPASAAAVSIFGSAAHAGRAPRLRARARRSARRLGEARLRGHHRRRARDHGGRQPRRARGAAPARVGLNIELPFEQAPEPLPGHRADASTTSSRARSCSSATRARSSSSPAASARSTSSSRRSCSSRRGKIRHFPVVLVGSGYWDGLIDWMRERLAADGMIAPADLDLMRCDGRPRRDRRDRGGRRAAPGADRRRRT